MKKIAIVFVAMMFFPCTVFGMQMLNNSSMDKITGQSGVSIAYDDIQAFLHIDRVAYIDSDGINSVADNYLAPTFSGAAGGAFYLDNFQIDMINVNAITGTSGSANGLHSASAGKIPLFFNYASTAKMDGGYLGSTANSQTLGLDHMNGKFVASALTLDVTDNLPILTEGFQYNSGSTSTIGGVIIGIPTIEVYVNSLVITPRYTGDIDGNASTAANNNAANGTIEIDGITTTYLSGWLEIAPH